LTDRPTSALRAFRRPLTAIEQRLIRSKIRGLTTRHLRGSAAAFGIMGGGLLILWLVTVLVSDAPLLVITAFWLVAGGVIALWVWRDMRVDARNLEGMGRELASAPRRNEAEVYDVRARAFAEFEEIEDEGACYAFELDGDRLVFITGQEFYEAARFPSLDFSLVHVLDEHGKAVDMLMDKRGAKAAPARTISAAIKETLDIPDHLDVRPGTVKEVERILVAGSRHHE